MTRVNLKPERTLKAVMWRYLLGPAMILDGLVATLTLGSVSVGSALEVSRRLALSRFNAINKVQK